MSKVRKNVYLDENILSVLMEEADYHKRSFTGHLNAVLDEYMKWKYMQNQKIIDEHECKKSGFGKYSFDDFINNKQGK